MTFIPRKTGRISFFDEQATVQKKTLFVSEPVAGAIISKFRDDLITTNGAFISGSIDELVVATGTGSNSTAILKTKRRAQYIPGFELEVGVGVRIETLPSGTQSAKWGYFDQYNGLGYGIDSQGMFTFVRKTGNDVKTYQSNWNKDTLDGSGSSGINLDLTRGTICQMNFSWYGYGDVRYSFYPFDSGSIKRRRVLAQNTVTENSTSIETPNQPIRIEVKNGNDGGEYKLFIGGRQASTFGDSGFLARRFATYVTGAVVNSDSVPTPLISFAKKDLFGSGSGQANSVQVKLDQIEYSSDQNVIFEVVYSLSGSLNKSTFTNASLIPPEETAIVVAFTGSNPTGDVYLLDTKFVQGGSVKGNSGFVTANERQRLILGDDDFVTVRAKHLGSPANVNVVLEWAEEW